MAKTIDRLNANVAVIDAETDPFLAGRVPAPFAWGFRWGDLYVDFWGPDATARLLDFLDSIPKKLTIYAHNGGKFDFFFLLEELGNPIKIINSRIVKAKIGKHTLRDSWAIIPEKLAAYAKEEIDYRLMEAAVRNKNQAKILHYLRKDCDYLYEMVIAFRNEFGSHLTIAGCAMKELEKHHPQRRGNERHDANFRPFYHGGRVEYFGSGVIRGNWKVFDVNSMYPDVMKNCEHPAGLDYLKINRAALDPDGWVAYCPGRFYFAEVEGWNQGALPVRRPAGGLSFSEEYGTFFTTSHELRAALMLGKFKIAKIHCAWVAMNQQSFAAFIDHFTEKKIGAERAGNKLLRSFYKRVMNSSYGKFGMNPESFEDYHIQQIGEERPEGAEWELKIHDPDFYLWGRPTPRKEYYDVAIAASVTSAARAKLMHALHVAERPIYCDTDSIICEGMRPSEYAVQHESELGAWKTEASGDRIAIAGKKLYALFRGRELVKSASKGANLTGKEIERIARGETVRWESEAPNFSLLHEPRFVARNIRRRVS